MIGSFMPPKEGFVGANDPIIRCRTRTGVRRKEGGWKAGRVASDLEQILDRLDGGAEVFVDVHLILHRLAGMQHGGVILTADHLADA